MGKTAVFVLACLQQIDASEKAGNLTVTSSSKEKCDMNQWVG